MQNPTVKVLSTLTAHQVLHLLMGGQACVFYGAAHFNRDADLAILSVSANLGRRQAALKQLHGSDRQQQALLPRRIFKKLSLGSRAN